ncbi:OLC1v1001061C1 [Oldenlandia corymbosa var. corymbosa]|uniref:OLC1v1001061C1 n=1 Tax=Oldenlandia corymbosa var. corymbosa TaxID=529605 RepID=A0AAV1D4S2_OLDCO|nr:OLC1v1001061C1 [Oldenlandia corymbosa var. corymbosa]
MTQCQATECSEDDCCEYLVVQLSIVILGRLALQLVSCQTLKIELPKPFPAIRWSKVNGVAITDATDIPSDLRSTERKRISKCLTEEAMAYFDGCISISTSDGSDLSAPEDPPRTSAGIFTPVSDDVSSPHQNSSINASLLYVSDCSSNSRKKMNDHDQLMPCSEDFDLKADGRFERVSISPRKKMIKKVKSGISKQSYQFSFAQRAKEEMI